MMATKKIKANKKMVFAVIVLVILAVAIPFALEYKKSGEKKMQSYYDNWLPDNCNCLERERKICGNSTFTVKGDFCVNEELELFTYPSRSCSQYNCTDGNIYGFNLETKKWEVEK